MGSSQTRARTRVPCIGRWILNHCATREAHQPLPFTFKRAKLTKLLVAQGQRPMCMALREPTAEAAQLTSKLSAAGRQSSWGNPLGPPRDQHFLSGLKSTEQSVTSPNTPRSQNGSPPTLPREAAPDLSHQVRPPALQLRGQELSLSNQLRHLKYRTLLPSRPLPLAARKLRKSLQGAGCHGRPGPGTSTQTPSAPRQGSLLSLQASPGRCRHEQPEDPRMC